MHLFGCNFFPKLLHFFEIKTTSLRVIHGKSTNGETDILNDLTYFDDQFNNYGRTNN